jgi:drug/metabolite transporter (DMT)-like permease
MSRTNAALALLLAAAVWGLAFIFQKSAMVHVGPLAFIAARGGVAALALAPLALREHRRAAAVVDRAFWRVSAIWGVAFFIAAWLQQTGIRTATVINTGFLTVLYVVLVPFMAWGWSGRAPNPIVWPAVMLSGMGIWLLGGGTLAAFSEGDVLVTISALFWAAHVVVTGYGSAFGRPIALTAIGFTVVALLATACAIAFEATTVAGLTAAAVAIAYVGLLSSALAFTIFTQALQYIPPAEAAVIVSMEVAFSALAAYLLLGERLVAIGWAGAALIFVATLLVQLGPALNLRLSCLARLTVTWARAWMARR